MFSSWLNNHKFELLSDRSNNRMCKIRDASKNSKRLLKVMNVSELDPDIVDEVVLIMNKMNNLNISGLMKYKLIENDENCLYLVMREYKTHLDRINPFKYYEESGSFEVLKGILMVLKSLNETGTIHSDLKPSNIFITDENEIKISDYCINLLYKGREGKKFAGKMEDLCFICYDELLGKELDISSDIWNFGLVFYYIESGKYPFVGKNMSETLLNILNINYIPLSSETDSDGLNKFLRKVLVKEKKDRLKLDKILKELKRLNEPELPVTPHEVEDLLIPPIPIIIGSTKVADWMKNCIDSKISQCKNSNENELNFDGLEMKDEEMKYLFSSLDTMKNIIKIDVSSQQLSSIGFTFFSYSLKFFPNLEQLLLSWNSIGNGEGFKPFSENVHFIPKLKELVMVKCDLRDSDIKYLSSHFEDIHNLERLNFSNNKIGDYGVKCICDSIDELTRLQDLHLENNEVGDKGGEILLENLDKYKNSRWLYIHHNKMSNYDDFIEKMREKYPDKSLKIM